jgi:hypothetical protein
MSLRYGRHFDATVRGDLAQAKGRLGPVLPEAPATEPDGDWRELPLIKSRLAGGYCLRTAAQGVCANTNICEHCPNFRSEPAMLTVLSAQRVDATALTVLSAQRVDATALAEDAERRGWNDEPNATPHSSTASTRSSPERVDSQLRRPAATLVRAFRAQQGSRRRDRDTPDEGGVGVGRPGVRRGITPLKESRRRGCFDDEQTRWPSSRSCLRATPRRPGVRAGGAEAQVRAAIWGLRRCRGSLSPRCLRAS